MTNVNQIRQVKMGLQIIANKYFHKTLNFTSGARKK